MKRFINVSLYIVIFLLVVSICVISIKKFFDIKQVHNLDNILATNFISDFVSFNEIEIVLEYKDDMKNELIAEEMEEKDNSVLNSITDNGESILEEKQEKVESELVISDEIIEDEKVIDENLVILFDGLTEEALVSKLEKHLKNELSGTSSSFVNYYKNYGLDPYLAVAIVLHETGCSWTCSSLVRECYNYGGMKGGTNKYKDTNYTCYSSKEDGINAYLNMLYNNYYSKGLTTPELINPKYASSLEWAAAINRYIDKIKNS